MLKVSNQSAIRSIPAFTSTITIKKPIVNSVDGVTFQKKSLTNEQLATEIMDRALDSRYPSEQQSIVDLLFSMKNEQTRNVVIQDLKKLKDETVRRCVFQFEDAIKRLG